MDKLLEKVIEIARNAGKLMITERNVDIGLKDTKENYVTSTDLKIQKKLREELLSALPGSQFMGEEEDLPGTSNSYSKEVFRWIVDPIDGTANYARGIPMSVVAIALSKGDKVHMGIVYQPYLDEMYYAVLGQGAFLNGKPIHVSDRTLEHSMLCTAWSCYNKKRAPLCFDITQRMYDLCEDVRRIGTAAYELCLLAKGSADLYFEVNLAPWDYAASTCILREAGGYSASQFGEVNLYGNGMVIAANSKANQDFLLNVVKEETAKHPEAGITFEE